MDFLEGDGTVSKTQHGFDENTQTHMHTNHADTQNHHKVNFFCNLNEVGFRIVVLNCYRVPLSVCIFANPLYYNTC